MKNKWTKTTTDQKEMISYSWGTQTFTESEWTINASETKLCSNGLHMLLFMLSGSTIPAFTQPIHSQLDGIVLNKVMEKALISGSEVMLYSEVASLFQIWLYSKDFTSTTP